MKKKLLFIFIIFAFFFFSSRVFAVELCSPKGYTILTINGIFTDIEGAIRNKDSLSFKFSKPYNNQSIKVDYLYNQTHLAGVADLVDTIKQGFFDQKSDYDLVEMLNDASQKVTTQKVLLVAHSQGNFYANNFYDKTASQPGGVPSQSIGVYGVASPANRVVGGGKYLTSDTDNVIASVVAHYLNILSPNIHIPLSSVDGNGHSFSDVYLKYQGDKIVSDIKLSLDKLKENDEQLSQDPCISPPELSTIHKIQGAVLAVADPTAIVVKDGVVITYNAGVYVATGVYNTGLAIGNGIINTATTVASGISSLAQSIFNNSKILANNNSAAVILSENESENQPSTTVPVTNSTITESVTLDNFSPKPKESTSKTEALLPSKDVAVVTPVPITVASQPVSVIHGGGGRIIIPVSNVTGPEGPASSSATSAAGSPDTTAPVISIFGESSIEVTKDTSYTDAGATATDDIDGVIDIITSGTVNTTVIGVYIITYTATDVAGNISTATRTVNVVALPDTTAPVISLLGFSSINVTKDTSYTDAGATATDDIDGNITANIITVNHVNVNAIGDYTVTYNVKDVALNSATQITRLVHVVAVPPDITPPDTPVITTLPQTVNTNSITIIGTAETNSTITISGGASTATGIATAGNYSIEVTLNQNVLNTLNVTAKDAANNVSNGATVLITHNNIPSAVQVFPTFTSDGKFTEEVHFNCTTNIADSTMMYFISDSDNTFHYMNGGTNGTYCPDGQATVMGNGQKFPDYAGYPNTLQYGPGWYYVSYFSSPKVCFYNSPTDCVFNNPPSIFFRLHRNATGVWSDSASAPDLDIVTKLKIITSAQTVSVNTASNIIEVESQNVSGALTNVASATHVSLSSNSLTGLFASSPEFGPCDNDNTGWAQTKEITISTNTAHRHFCYKDSTAGTPLITISATGLTLDSQTITVNSP